MDLELHRPAASGRVGGAMPRRGNHLLHALSADAELLRRVHRGELRGEVHTVFDRVVNIATRDGELFTLACRAVDDAPNTARVDLAAWRGTAVHVGDPVHAAAGRLWIAEDLSIACEATTAWDCALPPWPAHLDDARENLARVRQALAQHTESLREAMGAFDQLALRTVDARTQRLAAALRAGNQRDAVVHALALLGLGPGLTPSGDDVLLGLFAVLHLPGSPREGWLAGGAAVLAAAADATNAISLAGLRQAARGRVRASIATLLHELLYGGGPALDAALVRVLAIGASSGADIAAGLACGLELQLFHGSQMP
jgi:hypothetical protein